MKKIDNPYLQYMYSYPHKTAYGKLENIYLKSYLTKLVGGNNSLYFHIPFCQYKCGFCNLFSVSGQSSLTMEAYVDAMERHAKQLHSIMPEDVQFADLTLGGGTPLILPEHLLKKVFGIAREQFVFDKEDMEIVVETSPNQTTKEKLQLLKEEGVSRVSIGVQSFVEEELHVLKRIHKVENVYLALEQIRNMNFKCMNIDLIYGIPGQTLESLRYSLSRALEYIPEEIFIYPLYVKPGTTLYKNGVKPSPDTYEMYCLIRETLQRAGYVAHSMRRFVRVQCENTEIQKKQKEIIDRQSKNEEAEDNDFMEPFVLSDNLCGFGNTISIGCGGRSYIGNLHFCTPYTVQQKKCLESIKNYMEQEDYLKVNNGFVLSVDEQKRRYAIRHILFGVGINRKDYSKHFMSDVLEDFAFLKAWEKEGYIKISASHIALTEYGFSLSDYLGPFFISDEVKNRTHAFWVQ